MLIHQKPNSKPVLSTGSAWLAGEDAAPRSLNGRGADPGVQPVSQSTISYAWAAYSLAGPDGIVRYVGTTKDVGRRRRGHRFAAKHVQGWHVPQWVAEVHRAGSEPTLSVLETFDAPYTAGAAASAEAKWIAHFARLGACLLNTTNMARASAAYGLGLVEMPEATEGFLRAVDARELTIRQAAAALRVSLNTLYSWMDGKPASRTLVLRVAAWVDRPEPAEPAARGQFFAVVNAGEGAALAPPVAIAPSGFSIRSRRTTRAAGSTTR